MISDCKLNYPKVVSIDKEKLKEGDVHNLLLFAFASNPKEFERKLDDIGLEMNNHLEDVEFLYELHKLKGDSEGLLKKNCGERIIFNVVDFAKNITIDKSSKNPIKTILK